MIVRGTSQVERAYSYIRGGVLDGLLPPGSRIDFDAIMEALDISRQPIRDAVNRLSHESLVEVIPQVGCVIAEWNELERADTIRLGAVMEAELTALAALRRTDAQLRELASIQFQIEILLGDAVTGAQVLTAYRELNRAFHECVYASVASTAIEALANSFMTRCEFAVYASPARANAPGTIASHDTDALLERLRTQSQGHREIYDAIARSDSDRARAASFRHVEVLAAGIESCGASAHVPLP